MEYTKLANDDKQMVANEIEEEIEKALHDSSDSESDEDLNL